MFTTSALAARPAIDTLLKPLTCGLALLWLLLCAPLALAAAPMQVTFLNPNPPGHVFWDQLGDFMRAAADDLGVELEVLYPEDNNRFAYLKRLQQRLARDDKPDYLIFMFRANTARIILSLAELVGVKSFTINTDMTRAERSRLGAPREIFKHWLGQSLPDDLATGYDQAKYLIARARELQSQGQVQQPLQLLALGGGHDSSSALKRHQGLHLALQEEPDVELTQLLFTEWDATLAQRQTRGWLQRYPATQMIWSASDSLGLAAAKVASELNKTPLVGGVDWTHEGLAAVADGRLLASWGGHFMEGAQALILLHDYHQGLDFADELGTRFLQPLAPLSAVQLKHYRKQFFDKDWRNIDFKKYSRVHNPELKHYPFDRALLAD